MRYCQRCALKNEWPVPLAGELTKIGKCESCGRIAACTEGKTSRSPDDQQRGGEQHER